MRARRSLSLVFPLLALLPACAIDGRESPAEDTASAAQPVTTSAYGFVLSGSASGTTDVDPATSFNSAGLTNRVIWLGTGFYRVEMPYLVGPGGNVQVTAYGSDNARCEVMSWFPSSLTLDILVACHAPSGAPTDSRFSASYFRPSTYDVGAYLWADQPSASSYSPASGYSWSSSTGTIGITRSGVGAYTVRLPLAPRDYGNVLTTAYGSSGEHCKVLDWSIFLGVSIQVRCFAPDGTPSDARFSLSYAVDSVPSPYQVGAYLLANDTTSASYVPLTASSWSFAEHSLPGITEAQGRPTAARLGVGSYRALHPYLPGSGATNAHATAFGRGAGYCKVGEWGASGGQAYVGVRCFDAAGNAVDSEYTERYVYSSYLID